jgi:hypothetical protein
VKLVEDNRLVPQSNAKELELLLYLQSTPAGEKLFGKRDVAAGEGEVLNGATTTPLAMVEPWCEELIYHIFQNSACKSAPTNIIFVKIKDI